MDEARKPRRRWFRFSIRTMLIVVTLLCVVLGMWISRAVRQRDAVAALTKANEYNSIYYGYELDADYEWVGSDPSGPQWLRELIGIDFLATATAVYMSDAKDNQLTPLTGLLGLRSLNLSGCYEMTDAGIAQLKNLHGLRKLDIYGAQVTGDGLAALEPLTNLESLYLLDCDRITDNGIQHLGKIASLRKLGIDGSTHITDSGIGELRSLTNLRWLTLDFTDATTDAVLEQLQSLPKLRELELGYGEKQGGTGLKYLSGFRCLESLVLYGRNGLTEEGFSHLPALPRLKKLSLVSCDRLADSSLVNFEKLPNVEELFLSSPKNLGGGAMAHLQRLPRLKSLSIWGDSFNLTDSGLQSIGRLPSLRTIHLRACAKITDQGLMSLAGLSNLVELQIEVDQLSQLSTNALANLRRELPNCRIDYRQLVRGY